MNRTYDYNSYKRNYEAVRNENVREEEYDVVDLLGDLIVKAFSLFSSTAFKVCIAVLCLVGFVGVIGGVESGSLSIGSGIIAAVFMVFIEILCVSSPQRKNRK